jgi:hypothetical protein
MQPDRPRLSALRILIIIPLLLAQPHAPVSCHQDPLPLACRSLCAVLRAHLRTAHGLLTDCSLTAHTSRANCKLPELIPHIGSDSHGRCRDIIRRHTSVRLSWIVTAAASLQNASCSVCKFGGTHSPRPSVPLSRGPAVSWCEAGSTAPPNCMACVCSWPKSTHIRPLAANHCTLVAAPWSLRLARHLEYQHLEGLDAWVLHLQ